MMHLADIKSPSFSGHESFPFRHAWLKKGFDKIKQDPNFFSQPDALISLGVGKNMVSSIRHWMLALGLAETEEKRPGKNHALKITPFAESIFSDSGWDPYLEDEGTLWILHRRLVTEQQRTTTWWWAFNRPHTATLRKSTLLSELTRAAHAKNWRTSPNTIKRDVDCFIRSYLPTLSTRGSAEDAIACPLTALGLIQPTADRDELLLSYGWQPSLPEAIFQWGLAEYLESHLHSEGKEAGTVSLEDLLFDEDSPGRVFRLNEEAMISRLILLDEATTSTWTYDETVGLRQLVVREKIRPNYFLMDYYRPGPKLRLVTNKRSA